MGWDEIGFVKASQVRLKVLQALADGPATPKELTGALKLHFPQVSTALAELTEKGLAECLTKERVKGRIYGVTKEGKDVLGEIA